MLSNKHIFSSLPIIVLALFLQACGGGSSTTSNPNTGTDRTTYNGPPAATEDVRAYQLNVWQNLNADNRCGQCHGDGQQPTFVNLDDVNAAYTQALPIVNQQNPSSSLMVTKVGGGHNCWLDSEQACADSIERMIINWTGSTSTSTVRQIQLTVPNIKDPGTSKTFPALPTDNGANSFQNTIYPLLTANCQGCHEENSSEAQSPFFASTDLNAAYAAAKPKFDIDNPDISRLVVRLRQESHNCWTNSCANDAQAMEDAIIQFASGIVPVTVDSSLVISKALTMLDGIVSTGGSRHESNLVSIWEFKTGIGGTAFDTAGIEPAVNLTLTGSYEWLGAFGLDFSGGKAQGDTTTSKRVHDAIRSSGEYSLEAWVIPANVTQEDANIVSYSFGATLRNFTLGQTLYNYNLYNRTNQSDANGEAFLSTEDAGEILQSSLQHVVATYDPIIGRSIYVNGELIDVNDDVTVSSISDWNDGYAVVMGNEISNNRMWQGKLRMVAIHSRILTPEQIQQNFEIGVGLKYFLLFSVSERIGTPECYPDNPDSSGPAKLHNCFIMFEVSQFDEFGYLFNTPTFINLDPDWVPDPINIKGIRIALNGKEAIAGQTFANLDVTLGSGEFPYVPGAGQLLSRSGAVIQLEKGTGSDEFFLTFEKLGEDPLNSHAFDDPPGVAPTPGPDAELVSDIGVRTFDEINASIAAITGVPVTNPNVEPVFEEYRRALPAAETFNAYLSSHQMAVAQLSLVSCSELVENRGNTTRTAYFPGFTWTNGASTAFATESGRDEILDPILEAVANIDPGPPAASLTTQPDETILQDVLRDTATQDLDAALVSDAYESLFTQMITPPCNGGCDSTSRTEEIVKAVCAAAIGSAVMLVQ